MSLCNPSRLELLGNLLVAIRQLGAIRQRGDHIIRLYTWPIAIISS
jgi:hypothetical protein